MWEREQDTTLVNFGNASFLFGKVVPSYGGVSVEEFLQVEFPELAVGMLYFGEMHSDEAVVVDGVKKYSDHIGYMKSFACKGACTDKRRFKVITIDAKNYNAELLRSPDDPEYGAKVSYDQQLQFSSPHVLRDVAKARAGFRHVERVSTGMWGCGQFKGNPYLKFLEQLVAASQAGVDEFAFSAYGAPKVSVQCEQLLRQLQLSKRAPDDVLAFITDAREHDVAAFTSEDAFLERLQQWWK